MSNAVNARRWSRFNLRTLFAVTTAVGLGIFVAGILTAMESRGVQPMLFRILLTTLAGPPAVLCWFFQPTHETALFMIGTPVFYAMYAFVYCQRGMRLLFSFALGFHAGCGFACLALFSSFG